jgi:hypothetical protein
VVNVPAARDKYPKTYSVLEDLTNESNTWRLMGKVSHPEGFFLDCVTLNLQNF